MYHVQVHGQIQIVDRNLFLIYNDIYRVMNQDQYVPLERLIYPYLNINLDFSWCPVFVLTGNISKSQLINFSLVCSISFKLCRLLVD